MKIKNQLTNLDVGEVSFVDKGAIGEVFTVLKCETGNASLENELINNVQKSGIAESLKGLSDTDFVGMMGSMMSRYQEINKGGDNDMNEEAIKAIIKSAMEESMTTVNKNFVAVNKSVDELQKAFKSKEDEAKAEASKDELDAEGKKTANAKTKSLEDLKAAQEEKDSKVTKSMEDLTNIVKSMAESLVTVSKSVNGLTELKLDTVITDFTKRLETVEETENASNQGKDEIEKNAGDEKKVVFWKSILGNPEQE